MGEEEPPLPCPFPLFAPFFPPAVASGSSVVLLLLLLLSPFPPPSFVPPFPAVSLAVSAGRRRNLKLVVWQTLGGRKEESRR